MEADLGPAAELVSTILGSGDVCAEDGARLVGALGMADAYRHARMCLRVIEDHRPGNLDPETALSLTYAHRFAGVSFDNLKDVHPSFRYLVQMADLLPPSPPSLREMGLQGLTSNEAREIGFRGTPAQTIAWLESLEGTEVGRGILNQDIAEHFAEAPLDVFAPLSATLRALSGADGPSNGEDPFGTLDNRMRRIATELTDCVHTESRRESDGTVVTVILLVPEEDSTLHDRSVETCRLIFDLLPEADIAETIVLTPEGDRYSFGDYEEGHKTIPRRNLPRPRQTADNANFLRAGRLLLASRYWTEPVRVLANTSSQLLGLWNDGVSWLINPHHNRGRRRDAVKILNSLVTALAAGPKVPVNDENAGDRNSAMEAMSEAVAVVRDIATRESPGDRDSQSLGIRCRGAAARIMEARQGNLPRLSTTGNPLPEALDEMLTQFADILLVRGEKRVVPLGLSRRTGRESWVDVARRCMDAVALTGYQAEKVALKDAFGMPQAGWEIHRVRHPDMKSPQFLTDWWVLVVSSEADVSDFLALLGRFTPEMEQQLAFRTFVVFGAADSGILPIYGFQLGGSKLWPASEADLQKCLGAGNRGHQVAPTTSLGRLRKRTRQSFPGSRAISNAPASWPGCRQGDLRQSICFRAFSCRDMSSFAAGGSPPPAWPSENRAVWPGNELRRGGLSLSDGRRPRGRRFYTGKYPRRGVLD